MSEHIYELKHPFKYANKGEQVDASFITVFAPTFKQIDKVAPIKQAFTVAIDEISSGQEDVKEKEGEKESEGITPSQVLQLLYRANADITKLFLHAQELFKSGAALVDGESKLTIPLMEKMSLDDFEGLVGVYIANFIVPSLMDGTENSTD
jgi:hypothetical protein